MTWAGLLGYLLAWGMMVLASGISISALGFAVAPAGSAPLDTIAVVMLILPAAILARCVHSRAPDWELTRSRRQQPWALGWATVLGATAAASPVVVAGLLHPAINVRLFIADWYLTIGICLFLTAIGPAWTGATGSFAVLVAFSTPGLVPWHFNVVYNVDLVRIALFVGVGALLAGTILSGLRRAALASPPGRARQRHRGQRLLRLDPELHDRNLDVGG